MSEDIRNSVKPGMIVRVHQKIKETNSKGEEKERVQVFEGMVIVVKHGNGANATLTVRKVSNGVGVEKIFPVQSPVVGKIELVREMKVRQARAYYLRDHKKKLKEVKKPKAKKVEKKKEEPKPVKKIEKPKEEKKAE